MQTNVHSGDTIGGTTIRAAAIAGVVSAAIWIVALVVEYQSGLRPPGDGSALYRVDQAAFVVAEFGYLVMLVGLLRSRAGGDGWFGRLGIAIWMIGIGAIVAGMIFGLFGAEAIFLLPIGGLGQLLGSNLAAVAVLRARRWSSWRRLAPGVWAIYFVVFVASVAAGIPLMTTPAIAPATTAPSELAEAAWQLVWLLVAVALYVESSRHPTAAGSARRSTWSARLRQPPSHARQADHDGPMSDLAANVLSYGDNLDILRRYLPDASVDPVRSKSGRKGTFDAV